MENRKCSITLSACLDNVSIQINFLWNFWYPEWWHHLFCLFFSYIESNNGNVPLGLKEFQQVFHSLDELPCPVECVNERHFSTCRTPNSEWLDANFHVPRLEELGFVDQSFASKSSFRGGETQALQHYNNYVEMVSATLRGICRFSLRKNWSFNKFRYFIFVRSTSCTVLDISGCIIQCVIKEIKRIESVLSIWLSLCEICLSLSSFICSRGKKTNFFLNFIVRKRNFAIT